MWRSKDNRARLIGVQRPGQEAMGTKGNAGNSYKYKKKVLFMGSMVKHWSLFA